MLQALSAGTAQRMFGVGRVLDPSPRRVAIGSMQGDTVKFSAQPIERPTNVPNAEQGIDAQYEAIMAGLAGIHLTKSGISFDKHVHVFCQDPALFNRVVDGIFTTDNDTTQRLRTVLPFFVSSGFAVGFADLLGLYGPDEANRRVEYVLGKALQSHDPAIYNAGRNGVNDFAYNAGYKQNSHAPAVLGQQVIQLLKDDATLPPAVRQPIDTEFDLNVTDGPNPQYNTSFVVTHLMQYLYDKKMPAHESIDRAKAALGAAVLASNDTNIKADYAKRLERLTQ